MMSKIYREKKIIGILVFIGVILLAYVGTCIKQLEYQIFIFIGVTITSILLIMGIFHYIKVDDYGITVVKNFGRNEEIMLWKDVIIVTVYPSKLLNAIVLRSKEFGSYDMVISSSFKDYKGFVKTIYEKTKGNPDIFIDRRVTDMLEKWNK